MDNWVLKYIARQFGNPAGLGGMVSTFVMNRLNQEQYQAVIDHIDIQATDTVLDIGFGNGYLLRRLAKQNPEKMYGIEISPDMLNTTVKKNRKMIEQGKMQLILSDVQDIPLDDCSIDKACTVNTVYFWQDLHRGFSEIKRILKPDGIFLNVLYAREWLDKLPITRYGFAKHTIEQLEMATKESGLKIEHMFEIQRDKSICIIAKNV